MSKPNGAKGKKKKQKSLDKNASRTSKKLRVVNGRPWTGRDIQISEPTQEAVPPEVQHQRCRVVAVLAYSSVVLLCLLGVYAFVMKDTPMMWRILATVQVLLICSIGSAAGPDIL